MKTIQCDQGEYELLDHKTGLGRVVQIKAIAIGVLLRLEDDPGMFMSYLQSLSLLAEHLYIWKCIVPEEDIEVEFPFEKQEYASIVLIPSRELFDMKYQMEREVKEIQKYYGVDSTDEFEKKYLQGEIHILDRTPWRIELTRSFDTTENKMYASRRMAVVVMGGSGSLAPTHNSASTKEYNKIQRLMSQEQHKRKWSIGSFGTTCA